MLPPHSPELNGADQRANRTHMEGFYEVTACSLQIPQLNQELREWEHIFNTVRPRQAVGCLTPQEFLAQWQAQSNIPRCH